MRRGCSQTIARPASRQPPGCAHPLGVLALGAHGLRRVGVRGGRLGSALGLLLLDPVRVELRPQLRLGAGLVRRGQVLRNVGLVHIRQRLAVVARRGVGAPCPGRATARGARCGATRARPLRLLPARRKAHALGRPCGSLGSALGLLQAVRAAARPARRRHRSPPAQRRRRRRGRLPPQRGGQGSQLRAVQRLVKVQVLLVVRLVASGRPARGGRAWALPPPGPARRALLLVGLVRPARQRSLVLQVPSCRRDAAGRDFQSGRDPCPGLHLRLSRAGFRGCALSAPTAARFTPSPPHPVAMPRPDPLGCRPAPAPQPQPQPPRCRPRSPAGCRWTVRQAGQPGGAWSGHDRCNNRRDRKAQRTVVGLSHEGPCCAGRLGRARGSRRAQQRRRLTGSAGRLRLSTCRSTSLRRPRR
jgi:hypothetical protein